MCISSKFGVLFWQLLTCQAPVLSPEVSWGAAAAPCFQSEVPASCWLAMQRTWCFLTHIPSGPGRLPSTGFVLVPVGDWKRLSFPHLRHSFESNSPMAVHCQRKAMTSTPPALWEDARISQRYAGNADTGLELPKALLLLASLQDTWSGPELGRGVWRREGNAWALSSSSPQRKEGSWSINTSAAFAGKLEGVHLLWGPGREGGWVHEIQAPLREVKFWFSYPEVFICPHGWATQLF